MTNLAPIRPSAPLADFTAGTRDILPVTLAAFPIGLLYGSLATQKGLTMAETVLTSATIFAGALQFVALDLWASPAPWVTLTLTALLVNARHIVMGASLARHTGRFTLPQKLAAAFPMADENWAFAERRARHAALTPAYYAGLCAIFYVNWVASSALGTVIGAAIPEPQRLGLDFAFTAVFIAVIVGFVTGGRSVAVIAAAAVGATGAHLLALGRPVEILLGTVAGIAVAVLMAQASAPKQQGAP